MSRAGFATASPPRPPPPRHFVEPAIVDEALELGVRNRVAPDAERRHCDDGPLLAEPEFTRRNDHPVDVEQAVAHADTSAVVEADAPQDLPQKRTRWRRHDLEGIVAGSAIRLREVLQVPPARVADFETIGEQEGRTAAVPVLTFHVFAETWKERRGRDLVSAPIDYRLKTIEAFALPGAGLLLTFGEKRLDAITVDDIEAFRDAPRDSRPSR